MRSGLIGPLEITSLAFGGAGVARFDGRVIFVRGAVPGDLGWVRLLREKKRYAEAEAVHFDNQSPLRREPECPVFGECGGCQWQMLPYPQQLAHKEQIFRETMQRQCGVADERISSILESPDEWHTRSRVQFKCHQHPDGKLIIGFYRPNSHFVVDVTSCPIADPDFNLILPAVRDLLQENPCASRITQIDMEKGEGSLVRLVVHSSARDAAALTACFAPLLQRFPIALFLQTGSRSKLHHLTGPVGLVISVDEPGIQLTYGAGGFAQINLVQNRRMVDEALRMASPEKNWRVLDLFCGMGNFSLPFARRVSSLIGVEEHAGSIAQAKQNASDNQIKNVSFMARSATGACKSCGADQEFDLVILDPPRSGAKEVVAELLEQRVKRILYVSCDPMTLARDLKILLEGGYRLRESRPLDMFPQTYHIESLTLLEYSV